MNYTPAADYIAMYLTTGVLCWKDDRIAYGKNFDMLLSNGDLFNTLIQTSIRDYPKITFLNNDMTFIHFDSKEGIFLIGPFKTLFTEFSSSAVNNIVLPELEGKIIHEGTPVILQEAVRLCLMLFNLVNDTEVTEGTVLENAFSVTGLNDEISRKTVDSFFENREIVKKHNAYELEQLLMDRISEGDLEGMQKVWEFPSTGELGVTSKDPVRNGKNLAITNVILSGRAAIKGGVDPDTAFTMIDSSIMQIEELKDMMVLQSLVESIQLNFVKMVQDIRRKNENLSDESALVTEAKSYISVHLHDRISAKEVSEAVHTHPNYLSSLFKKSEGVPLHAYIMNQKISAVESLLVFSGYTYSEIAQYLGFASQSHLGDTFKKKTGMTLKEYRDKYRP